MLIAIEGIDGSGKTTQARYLTSHLSQFLPVHHLRSGGVSSPLCQAIKKITHAPQYLSMTPMAELFLYLANLTQRVTDIIIPKLQAGYVVIAERYTASVLALAVARGLQREWVEPLTQRAVLDIHPTVVILCDAPSEIAFDRKDESQAELSRKELSGPSLMTKIREEYHQLAARNDNWVIVDCWQQTEDQVFTHIRGEIDKVLDRVYPIRHPFPMTETLNKVR